ncbi:MAG TPA: M1 family metallopeptidase, partial [Firmicutes bacterium]|nr:M1 family metallopeptidase [Bacillota bacterium]
MKRHNRLRLFFWATGLGLALLAAVLYLRVPWRETPLLPAPQVPDTGAFAPAVYDLDVALDPGTGTLRGVSRVEYTNNEAKPLPELYFHLYPNAAVFAQDVTRPGRLTIHGVRIGEQPARWEARATQLKVVLPQPLVPKEQVALTLTWDLTVPDYPGRLGENEGIISLGNWYPILAVYDAAGWHLDPYYERGDPFYSEVARYQVRLTLPDTYQAAATGNLRSRRDLPGPTKELIWQSGLVRDFALALSQKYQVVSAPAGRVLVQSYFPQEERDGGERVLAAGRAALDFFSRTFGPYPYDQFTLAATGFYQGGMEYPNIVFLSRQFYGPADADILEYVAVHETAHQWWYGVVGNNEVEEAWLDEGLTEFSTLLFYEKVRG